MLLYACLNYEARHGRNHHSDHHRQAKARLEAFIAASPATMNANGHDLRWFQEWLMGEDAYEGTPLWHGLYMQVDFALNG